MKKFFIIILLIFFSTGLSNASLYNFLDTKDDPKVTIDKLDFDTELLRELNDLKIYLGIGRGDTLINETLYELLRNSAAEFDETIINNDRYFVVSGCRYQSCPEKGFLWIDKKEKIVIGALIHYFFKTQDNYNKDGNLLVISKKFKSYNDLPQQFNNDLEQWLSSIKIYDFSTGKNKSFKPAVKRFVNSNNLITEIKENKKFIEVVCTPYEEWDSSYDRKRIWFKSLKEKFIFHFDEENKKIVKIGITKDKTDLKNVDIPVEKINGEKVRFEFQTSANLSAYEDVVNNFTLTDFGGIGSFYRFGLYLDQYRLKPEQTLLIAKEMRNLSLSEFERARDKVQSETFQKYGYINSFGGMAALCDNSEIRNYN